MQRELELSGERLRETSVKKSAKSVVGCALVVVVAIGLEVVVAAVAVERKHRSFGHCPVDEGIQCQRFLVQHVAVGRGQDIVVVQERVGRQSVGANRIAQRGAQVQFRSEGAESQFEIVCLFAVEVRITIALRFRRGA